MPQHKNSYGVTDRMQADDPFDEAAAELSVNGYTVLQSGLDTHFIDRLKSRLHIVYEQQAAELGGEDAIRRINDADVARCVLSYDSDFLCVATTESLLRLAGRIFGPEFVLTQQNGIINRPDRENNQANWHRDLPYQHWTSSKPIAINALLCIDDFTLENGATFVLPGTHRVAEFPTESFVCRNERQLAVPAGSYLVLDAMLYHRAGINRSLSVRRAVNHVIGLPFMAQQVDIPSALHGMGGSAPEDPAIQKYLGYRWTPAASAKDWRERRLRQLYPAAGS